MLARTHFRPVAVRRLGSVAVVAVALVLATASPGFAATKPKVGARHLVGSTFTLSTTNNVISCPPGKAVTATTCYLVGDGPGGTPPGGMPFPPSDYHPEIVPVHNGKPGSPIAFPGSESAELVSCTSSTSCEAAGYSDTFSKTAFISLSSGHPGKVVAVTGVVGWNGLACFSGGNCVAAGTWRASESSSAALKGVIVRLVKGKSSTEQFLPGTAGVSSLSCQSASSCEIVGSTASEKNGYFAAVTNGRAGAIHVVKKTSGLYTVACGWTKGTCIARGGTSLTSSGIFPAVATIKGSSAKVTKKSAALPATSYECLSVGHCLEFGVAEPNTAKEHAVVAVVVNGKAGAFVTVPEVADLTWLACTKVGSCAGVGSSLTGQYPGDIQRTFTVTY